MPDIEHASPPVVHGDQFRLVRLQTFNWGTFSGLFEFAVAEKGHLFVGPSGSGKSTILDAHTALLTPPKWLDFNVAAREAERHGKDRSAITYVRGAWAHQTAESGEYASQYLRTGTTWSAVAETYRHADWKRSSETASKRSCKPRAITAENWLAPVLARMLMAA